MSTPDVLAAYGAYGPDADDLSTEAALFDSPELYGDPEDEAEFSETFLC